MHHYKSCCTINKDMRERQSQYVVQEERSKTIFEMLSDPGGMRQKTCRGAFHHNINLKTAH